VVHKQKEGNDKIGSNNEIATELVKFLF